MNKFHITNFISNSIFLFFLLLFIACEKQQEVDITKTIQFEGKIFKLESEKPFSGIIYNNYPEGQREYEGHYKNGIPNGLLTYWYEHGETMRKGRLKNGIPVGRWTYYNIDASIQKIIDY